jgi:hypothetical protein
MTQNNKFEGWTYVLALNYKDEPKYGYYIHNMTIHKGEIMGDIAFCIEKGLDVVNVDYLSAIMHVTDIYTSFPLTEGQVISVLDSYNLEIDADKGIVPKFKLPKFFSYSSLDGDRRYYVEVLSIRPDGDVHVVKYSCSYSKSKVVVTRDTFMSMDILKATYKEHDGQEWDGNVVELINKYTR